MTISIPEFFSEFSRTGLSRRVELSLLFLSLSDARIVGVFVGGWTRLKMVHVAAGDYVQGVEIPALASNGCSGLRSFKF